MSHVCLLDDQPCGCDPKADPKAKEYPCARARQLGKVLRLMASDKPGEAQNASAIFMRMCQSENLGSLFNDLAEQIEIHGVRGRPLYSEKDIKDVTEHAQEQARAEVGDGPAQYFDADGEPIWLSIAAFCQQHCDDGRLSEWQKGFANGIFDKLSMWGDSPSPKRMKHLLIIFMKLGESCAADVQARYIRNI
jgi:hypothetical protein